MISKRFENDGISVLNLNELQTSVRNEVISKIRNSVYKFESISCPLCNSSENEMLAKKDRYGIEHFTCICVECGLVYTNPRMTQESYNEFYNSEYRKLYSGKYDAYDHVFSKQYQRGHEIYHFLKQNKYLNSKKKILEVGCGAGGILKLFKEKKHNVYGIDLGLEYLEYGRNKYNLDLKEGTIDDLDKGFKFDVIIYSHVLEHILSPLEEIRKIKNILSPSGIIYVEVPGIKNLYHPYQMDFLRYLQNAHVYNFSRNTLENVFIESGYYPIYLDEYIRGVFKLGKAAGTASNDYTNVMEYLEKLEKNRSKLLHKIYYRINKKAQKLEKKWKSFRLSQIWD